MKWFNHMVVVVGWESRDNTPPARQGRFGCNFKRIEQLLMQVHFKL